MTEQGVIRKPDWTIDPAKMRTIADEEIDEARKKFDEIAKTPSDKVSLQTLKDFAVIEFAKFNIPGD